MLQLLETGQALYVLAGICFLGVVTRMITSNLYKRLIKESGSMATTKNKCLRDLKQKTENTYRMNQGLPDSGAWLDHQLCEMKFGGLTLAGWGNLSMQLTWLCLLAGGIGAFFSYWYRLDTFYVVLYGAGAVLMSMFTMLFDNGTAGGRRELLEASLQDYLENILCPRLARSVTEDSSWNDGPDSSRAKVRSFVRLADRGNQADRRGDAAKTREPEPEEAAGMSAGRIGDNATQNNGSVQGDKGSQRDRSSTRLGGSGKRNNKNGRREAAATAMEDTGEETKASVRDVDYLKRSLEQIAASKEKGKEGDESWLKELGPDEVQLIGDILKEYLA